MTNNFVYTHLHTQLSNGITNIDSITDYHTYVDLAKKLGMKAICFTEHGSVFSWVKKKEYIESCGMKYIHGIEAYITEDDNNKTIVYSAETVESSKTKKKVRIEFTEYFSQDGDTAFAVDSKTEELTEIVLNTMKEERELRLKDNYHCVLIAKNYDGVRELNKIVSESFNRSDFHYHYRPRISIDVITNTSDNIIVTSACLGGVFNNGTPSAKEKMLSFFIRNKHRCYLEVQPHNCKDQREYNKMLFKLSEQYDIPLISGTDTHELNETTMRGRSILQKSKGVHFSEEDEFDLTFKTYDELVEAYQVQGALEESVYLQAIENTNILADSIEEFTLDRTPKYPQLYDDPDAVFKKKVNEGFLRRKLNKSPNKKKYLDRIKYEYETYKHNNAINFMLLEEDYKREMRENGVRFGYSRGSVSGSIIAYLLGITEIDSIKYNLNFERFMNRERISLADIDTDWFSEDRGKVREYLYKKEGLYCCDIVTFNTIALKGAIKDVCHGFHNENLEHLPDEVKSWVDKCDKKNSERVEAGLQAEEYPDELKKLVEKHSVHNVPFDYIRYANEIIALAETNEEAARKKYKDVFEYVDMLNGVVVSVGNHPAGCVVSPFPVDEWFGTFTTSTNQYPISMINMKEIDGLNFVKLDILGLTSVQLKVGNMLETA